MIENSPDFCPGNFLRGGNSQGSRRRREAAVVGERRGKEMERRFRRRGNRSEMDFDPTTGPPMAQEKAIAEAKAMNEQ